jgi:serine/threonine-protein kinase
MPLSAGTRLGAYEILALIGAGGMGEVYRARDSKLKREVAVKVLPLAFASDTGRLARFQREAEVLAAINHPNIATIYGVEDSALVMELVEGESLQSIAGRGPISVVTALRYATQMAEALEAAHEKGIVHRDVKPANVMVTSSGTVKVLDFGLATAFQGPESGFIDNAFATQTIRETQPGVILGTAGYMSPEQAAGKPADKRADIWSFGVVLWEMLTGRALFEGETSSHILAEVLRGPIDFDKLPRETPEAIRALLRRCLDRDVRNRLRDIGEARVAIQQAGKEAAAVPRRIGRLWPVIAGLLLLSVFVLAVRGWRSGALERADAPLHAVLELTPAESLGTEGLGRPHLTAMAFSPDGNTLVFSGSARGQKQLYKRILDQTGAVPIPGTAGAAGPFFSPDGQWVAFLAEGGLKKISMRGGPAVRICDTGPIWGAAWGAGGSIVFAEVDGSLKQVPAAGGAPGLLVQTPRGESYSSPEFLPDGRTLLFTARSSNNWEEAKILVRRPDGRAPQILLSGGADARYVPPGYLVYLRNGVLMAATFDAHRLAISGTSAPVADGIMQSVNASDAFYESGIGQFAISASGTLVYASGGIHRTPDASLVRVDRKGTTTDLDLKGLAYGLRFSPDGRRLAVSKTISYLDCYIEVYDLARGTSTRLTSEGQENWPVWSPDGKAIAFMAADGSIVSVQADGASGKETLVKDAIPASWSPDGELAYLRESAGRWTQIGLRPTSGQGEPSLFLESKSGVADVEFSPNGKWIAYVSNETGGKEVYVHAFPGPGGKQRISIAGGTNPAWARSGRELFYLDGPGQKLRTGSKMMVVDVETDGQFRAGTPRPLFVLPDGLWIQTIPLRNYDVYPDGQNFIVMRPDVTQEAPVTKLSLVLNWSEEMKRRVPTAN